MTCLASALHCRYLDKLREDGEEEDVEVRVADVDVGDKEPYHRASHFWSNTKLFKVISHLDFWRTFQYEPCPVFRPFAPPLSDGCLCRRRVRARSAPSPLRATCPRAA